MACWAAVSHGLNADRNTLTSFAAASDGQTYSGENVPPIIYNEPPRTIENNTSSLM
jgi:hypothetical protein